MKKDKMVIQKATIKGENIDERQQQTKVTQDKLPDNEYGGRKGPDPTRYGDWEKNGRCIDF